MFSYLLKGLGLGFAAASQPGPFQAYLINQSLSQGWRKTVIAAAAPLISDGPIILLVLLVLKQVPVWFQRFLYLAGGVFILFLAWVAFDQWRRYSTAGLADGSNPNLSLRRAVLTNFLSPGPYLFWSLVNGPILITGWQSSPLYGFVFLLAFYGSMIGLNLFIILIVSQANRFGNRLRRMLIAASAIALLIFGVWQLWHGIVGF